MNSTKQKLDVQVFTAIPSDYHKTRLRGWDNNTLFWARYIDSEGNRAAMLDRLAQHISDQVGGMAPKPRILDFGCGEGLFLRLCSQRMPTAELTGIDFSASMLAIASNRSHLIPITFRLADIESTELSFTSDFDVAVSTLVLDEVEDLATSFGNIAESLRPGGTAVAVILDPITERLRHSFYLGNGGMVDDADSDELFLITKHFRVGHNMSPSPYNRIIRPDADYIDAAGRSGLQLDGIEIWPVGSASASVLIGPMVRVLLFSKSNPS
jgi:trans-aconitate methyltransferase